MQREAPAQRRHLRPLDMQPVHVIDGYLRVPRTTFSKPTSTSCLKGLSSGGSIMLPLKSMVLQPPTGGCLR